MLCYSDGPQSANSGQRRRRQRHAQEHKEVMRVELLRLEDVFDLTNQGLVCTPFFQPSPQGPFNNFSAVVTVQPPDRPAFDVDASFNLSHFKILDVDVPVERRWKIVTCLGKIPRDSVPVGSIILCDRETKARLSKTI